MPTYSSTIPVNLVTDNLYKVSAPANVEVFYSGKKIWGAGANNYFVANDVNEVIAQSSTALSGDITFKEILTNFYDAYDGTGGTWCYQPGVERWTGKYSGRPEWMSLVGNRLMSFKEGKPYVHNGAYNTFYGDVYNSVIAGVHNEAGNTVKVYKSIGVEGDTPDRMHLRTEVPNVQSSDLVANEFSVREGVSYSDIMRDRLSPNVSGTAEQKLLKGDPVRGETCKFLYLLSSPSTKKSVKFININFIPSNGQSV